MKDKYMFQYYVFVIMCFGIKCFNSPVHHFCSEEVDIIFAAIKVIVGAAIIKLK